MNFDTKLHHYCQNITKGHLQDIVEMYKFFGCEVFYIPPHDSTWLMMGQPGLRFSIQIAEVADEPVDDINKKVQTHIAFISDNPRKIIDKVKEWAKAKGFKFREGKWSDIELYFDLPEIFVNFVVEIMHTSILEK